ncbi:MAG: hypothetical protein AABZ12_14805 [Planctomycetota bacterium]
MARWVWFAGTGRLTHLGLMRESPASRRFASVILLILVFGMGLLQAGHVGWQRVRGASGGELPAVRPHGQGWFRVYRGGDSSLADSAKHQRIELWWNPAQAIVAGAAGLVGAIIACGVARALIGAGVEQSHRRPFRGEQRMTAALSYSTAWALFAIAGIFVLYLQRAAWIKEAVGGGTVRPEAVFLVLGGTLVGFAAAMWWFFLLRLGATAPAETRGRVTAFATLGAPMLVVAAAATWWFGTEAFNAWMIRAMRLGFE